MKISILKQIIIIVSLIILGNRAYSQTYYVKENETFEKPIIAKLLELNQQVTTKQDSSTYTIECVVTHLGISESSGYVIITDTKSGVMLARSKEEKGTTNAFNGYENSRKAAMEKVAKKDLANTLLQIKVKK